LPTKALAAISSILRLRSPDILDGSVEVKRHLESLRDTRFVNSPIQCGSGPSRKVFEMSKTVIEVMFRSSIEKVPVMNVSNKYNLSKLLRFPNDEGIELLINVSNKAKSCKLLRPPNDEGMGPVIEVLYKYNSRKLLRPPSEEGIEPLIPVLSKYKLCKLLRPLSDDGIGPVIDVLNNANCRKLLRPPSEEGIRPVI
jgi:hypothetical protein